MPSTRVVVTGLGTTSPVGGDVASTWQAMLSGTSGIRRLTDEWVDQLPVKIGGRVAVEPSGTTWYADGKQVCRSDAAADAPTNIISNLAVYAKIPPAASTTSAVKRVDYIRAWDAG